MTRLLKRAGRAVRLRHSHWGSVFKAVPSSLVLSGALRHLLNAFVWSHAPYRRALCHHQCHETTVLEAPQGPVPQHEQPGNRQGTPGRAAGRWRRAAWERATGSPSTASWCLRLPFSGPSTFDSPHVRTSRTLRDALVRARRRRGCGPCAPLRWMYPPNAVDLLVGVPPLWHAHPCVVGHLSREAWPSHTPCNAL